MVGEIRSPCNQWCIFYSCKPTRKLHHNYGNSFWKIRHLDVHSFSEWKRLKNYYRTDSELTLLSATGRPIYAFLCPKWLPGRFYSPAGLAQKSPVKVRPAFRSNKLERRHLLRCSSTSMSNIDCIQCWSILTCK